MKHCKRCGVEILDETYICPLCRAVLSPKENGEGTRMYPQVNFAVDKLKKFKNIILFCLLVVCVLLGLVNYYTYRGVLWSVIAIASVLYFGITISYSVFNRANAGSKILVQAVGAQILVAVIDYVLGGLGWSVNYVIPVMILTANAALVLLMVFNRMNWQSYFMYQIAITVFSFVPLILVLTDVAARPMMSILCVCISILLLLGTIVFGDRNVKNELIRRFHT